MSSQAAIAERIDRRDHRGAWIEMTRLAGLAPSTADCHVIAHALERLDTTEAGLTGVRVAILGNVTIDPIAPILTGRGVRSQLAIKTYLAPFDQWTQEALDPASGTFRFEPDVVVLALRLEELAPALAGAFLDGDAASHETAIGLTADRVGGVLRGLRARSPAKILLHAMAPPAAPALGMIDAFTAEGQRPAVRALNERLAGICARTGDAYLVDLERLIANLGYVRWHDARMASLARLPYTPAALHALAEEYLRYVRAFTGRVRKVLVTDLDDTLWGGVVGELGADHVRVGAEPAGAAYLDLQRALVDLHRRGVVLAINSTNNEDDAMAALDGRREMLLRRQHFAAARINWQDKAVNLIDIAQELGLALDAFVYIDDSAAECARVQAACPDVLVVPLEADVDRRAGTIRNLGVFDRLTYTDEDRQRGARYGADRARRESRESAQSLEQFYESLMMELVAEPVSTATLDRAAELTQRTNQFNVTTRRFTSDALSAHLADDRRAGFVFRLADRFGDHGWIGLAILEQRGDVVAITDLMLSCRVLKRTVETAVLGVVLDWAGERGASMVEGAFIATPRNAPASAFFADHGFTVVDAPAGDARLYHRTIAAPLTAPAWIRVRRRVTA